MHQVDLGGLGIPWRLQNMLHEEQRRGCPEPSKLLRVGSSRVPAHSTPDLIAHPFADLHANSANLYANNPHVSTYLQPFSTPDITTDYIG
mmetsp:Transcript_11669/g.16701  ORF Transcript_11669/g.16701 Transcript_11669/m.16701 type:complete len:90 (-) Transcript_11669:431-700(-)